MRFDVLGSLAVHDGERLVEIPRPKERAVLAALIIGANAVVPLDRLVAQLWGDEPPARAIGTLHAYISNLRRLLEPDRAARAPSSVILSRAPGYVLVAGPDAIDADRFERHVATAHAHLTQGEAARALAAYDEALALWRGPAYADFVYDDFADATRRRFDEVHVSALEGRLDALLTLGRHVEVAADAEALLTDEPLRERLWSQLIVALYRSGRQADALNTCRRARAALDELGLEPSEPLRRLEHEVLNQSPQLDLPPAAQPAGPLLAPTEPSRHPLIGREAELDAIRAARVALITGEAGIGKTALADEALLRSRATAAVGRCPESQAAPPLWPWAQLLRQLNAPAPPEELVALIDTMQDGSVALQGRLVHAIHGFLRERAAESPLILFFDDVQWADEVSLRLLLLALDDFKDASITFVVTLRTPSDVTPALEELLAGMRRSTDSIEIRLDALSPADTASLLAAYGVTASSDEASALHRRTGGNAFFTVELARLLSAEGGIPLAGIDSLGVPSGVRDVVRRRLARLPEQAAALLTVAAVVGTEVDVCVVQEASGADVDTVIDMFELATITGVLVERSDRAGVYRFAHDLVRETILDGLPGMRRARLHQRVLDAIVTVFGETRATVHALARHAVAAVPVSGPEPAIQRLLASARRAGRDLAVELAERQLRETADLIDQLPPSVERERLEVDVQARLGQTVFLARADLDEATRRQQHALRLCPPDDIAQLVNVLNGIGAYAPLAGDFDTGVEASRRALSVLAGTDDSALRAGAHYAASMCAWRGEIDEALRHLDAIAVESKKTTSSGQWAAVPLSVTRAHRGLTLALAGDACWLTEMSVAVEEAVREREDWSLCWCGAFAVAAAVAAGDRDACLKLAEPAAHVVARLNYTAPILTAGQAWAADGDPDVIMRALHDLERMHDGMFRAPVLTMLSDRYADIGRLEESSEARAAAAELARSSGQLGWLRVLERTRLIVEVP